MIAIVLLAVLAAIAIWTAFCYIAYYHDTRGDETHFATTNDDWKIALSRYRPIGEPRRHPVILCHGLSANRLTYDLAEEASLARFLAQNGFDVWVLELRGRGLSDRPWSSPGKRFGWSFDDYLQRDMLAAISLVIEQAKCARVHWVGHSMGGILLYSHLATTAETKLCSGIAVASSLDYSDADSDFRYLLPFRGLTRWIKVVPFGMFALWLSPLVGRIDNPLERFNYWPANLDKKLTRRLKASTLSSISAPVLGQLASAFQQGGLRSADGRQQYCKGLSSVNTPVLAIAGDRDRQCTPQAAQKMIDMVGAAKKQCLVFGPDQGHQHHYGHFDLLVGRNARAEVFPHILSWLEQHDGSE